MFVAHEAHSLRWFKSSRSAQNGACVELAVTSDAVVLRDSKDPSGPTLCFGTHEWREFITSVQAGTFDLAE